MENLKICDFMIKDPISISIKDKVSHARFLLIDHGFHHLPVTDDKSLVGIISNNDLIRLNVSGYGSYDPKIDEFLDFNYKIEDLMTKKPATLYEDDTLWDACQILDTGDLHAIPILNYNEFLTGIITTSDLIYLLMDEVRNNDKGVTK